MPRQSKSSPLRPETAECFTSSTKCLARPLGFGNVHIGFSSLLQWKHASCEYICKALPKAGKKAWPSSRCVLFCPWLTRCQSRALARPKSPSLLAPLCQRARLPISFGLSVSVAGDTHTMPSRGSRRLVNPYRGPLFRALPAVPPAPSLRILFTGVSRALSRGEK